MSSASASEDIGGSESFATPESPAAADGRAAAASGSGPTMELDGLSVALGGRPILHDLRATLRGRAIGLLGPNGAGKTTLIHTLLGFHRPTAGGARLLGREAARPGARREDLGYMPERESFLGGMSGVAMLRLLGELSGLAPAEALERAHDALFYVGLGEVRYRPVATYSTGMKQLAKLAQALTHRPRLIFLDEPTNALDPAARSRMLGLIGELRAGGTRLVISSHLLRDVETCCDEVLILRDGRVAAVCDLEGERRTHRKFVLLEVFAGDREGFLADLGAANCAVSAAGGNDPRVRVVLPPTLEIRALYGWANARGLQIRRFEYKRDSLEEIFLRAVRPGLLREEAGGAASAPPAASAAGGPAAGSEARHG